MGERERPSAHGTLLGAALAGLADAGAPYAGDLPERCATCAFRPGTMTNQMASSLLLAFNCSLGIDSDGFACHHGMNNGQPTKLCAGYLAARHAPFDMTKVVIRQMADTLDLIVSEPDEVRARFDAWIADVDPDDSLNDYERGRLYRKAFPTPAPREEE